MLDAVRFERLGLPAAAILTEPFRATGRAMAELQGFVDYAFATVPHPVASLSAEQALAVADAVTPVVERLLVDGVADPWPLAGSVDVAAATSRLLDDVVAAIAAGLRADGADLTAEQSGRRISFRLHIGDKACAECVMPSSMLVPMLQHRIAQELGPGLAVELHDPRDGGGEGPDAGIPTQELTPGR